jgi:hypothetical protein
MIREKGDLGVLNAKTTSLTPHLPRVSHPHNRSCTKIPKNTKAQLRVKELGSLRKVLVALDPPCLEEDRSFLRPVGNTLESLKTRVSPRTHLILCFPYSLRRRLGGRRPFFLRKSRTASSTS